MGKSFTYYSLFSGIEAASVAWEPLGWRPLLFSEIDEFPSAVLAARYPSVPNLGDITRIDWQKAMDEYDKSDAIIGGSPCFPAGALVMCEDGFKPIEDVKVGDLVVTHQGRLRRVTRIGSHVTDETVTLTDGSISIECTPNHPFESLYTDESHPSYVGDDRFPYVWRHADEMLGRTWLTLCWMNRGSYEQGEISHLNEWQWHAIGEWLRDAITQGKHGTPDDGAFEETMMDTFVVTSTHDDGTVRVPFSVMSYLLGNGEIDLIRLLDGFFHVNGKTMTRGRCGESQVGTLLAIRMLLLRGSHGHETIDVTKGDDGWEWRLSSCDGMVQDCNGYFRNVTDVKCHVSDITVYNIEVEEDHSYLVNGIAVHNCQSFSVAGKREGLHGTSGLMYEYVRAVQEVRPRWCVWENVPGAFSSEHGEAFRQLLSSLDDLGYGLAWRVLDSRHFGVPQRRRRVFLVGCLGDPERATKVLLDPKSMPGDTATLRGKGKDAATRVGDGVETADTRRSGREGRVTDVYALQSDGSTSNHGHGSGWNDTGDAYTLNTLDRQSVAYKMMAVNQRNEVRYDGGDGETVGAIPARPGGKQRQCVIEIHGGGIDPNTVGALCADDVKGINSQYVSQGKVVIEKRHDITDDVPDGDKRNTMSKMGTRQPWGRFGTPQTTPTRRDDTGNDKVPENADRSRQNASQAVIMASGQAHAEHITGASPTLTARQYKDPPVAFIPDDADTPQGDVTYVVRRLMPVETERLQGFPDGWTDLTGEDTDAITSILLDGPFKDYDERHRKQLTRNVRRWCAGCPDGKRYKATGNSMAVPVIRWLGERIIIADDIRGLPLDADDGK